jgi:hypothetical protein
MATSSYPLQEKSVHRAGKPSHTPKTPSVAPAAALIKPHTPSKSLKQGIGSDSGEDGYDSSVKSYLEIADVEKDGRDAAPDDATESKDIERADETGPQGRAKITSIRIRQIAPCLQVQRVPPASTRRH